MLKLIVNHINDTYGSKRGLLNSVWFTILTLLGGYRHYQEIDWSKVSRLVFICHGNICRSPLGDVYARKAGVSAESYGLHCRDGANAEPRAAAYAQSISISLEDHRSRNIKAYADSESDLLIVMEPAHLVELKKYAPLKAQTTLAGLWMAKSCAYIHDPYNTSDKFFSACEDKVLESSDALVRNMLVEDA
jgi:protein-tyrosine phosphatase